MDKVFFYVPDEQSIELFDKTIEECSIHNNFTCWVLATYLYLKKAGINCEITRKIPEKGILLADRDSLNKIFTDFGEVMLICAKGDRDFHPSAYLHIVQNPVEYSDYQGSIWNPYYIPLWPQTKLISRLPERGSRVENIAYIGSRSQLCEEFHAQKWSDTLDSLGYKWMPLFSPSQWNDYSHIDLVVAVRNFTSNNLYKYKPASKLINCWRAGVPAILASESAYLAERKSDLDFLIVDSVESTIEAIEKLKNNSQLYQEMIINGFKNAELINEQNLTQRWIDYFEKIAFPSYKKWLNFSSFEKKKMFLQRLTYFKAYALLKRFNKNISIFS